MLRGTERLLGEVLNFCFREEVESVITKAENPGRNCRTGTELRFSGRDLEESAGYEGKENMR